jgi:hypothetical protein
MSANRPGPSKQVPTLTEVVVLSEGPHTAAKGPEADAGEELGTTVAFDGADFVPTPRRAEEEIIQRILGELQRQVDLMLEYRLREALAPALARATDALIRDTRNELAATLKDVVARAVAQELSRHRRG